MKQTSALREYGRKRRFADTPEPKPHFEVVPPPRPGGRRFCVHEHHASHRHYDLRLEIDGVLKSWAVPKGPTLDPEVKRLAMATEDHPLDYLTFEGTIPEGNYGAGEVIVWDLGDYEPVGDTPPLKQWEQGHLKFRLNGKKLHGEFALAHMAMRPTPERQQKENAWLLIKKHDTAQRFGDTADRHPGSVIHRPRTAAGKGLQLVKRGRKDVLLRRRSTAAVQSRPARTATRKTALPKPMLATLSDQPFNDPAWLFEVKWDGIRALADCRGGRVRLISRSGRDISAQYPELATLPAGFPAAGAVLDGEIVALDASGKSSFHRLQQRMNLSGAGDIARAAERVPVDYYAFDLLAFEGTDLTRQPLRERKRRLAELPWSPPWRFSDHVSGEGRALFALARQSGLEGIVAKRADSTYESGRSSQWLKFKLQQRQDVVVVGYTDPKGARTDFGALALAVYAPEDERFVYAGRAGTGFDAATRQAILAQLQPESKPAVAGAPAGNVHWVKPQLVAEVKFAEWTPGGNLRAPVFLGLRPDKEPRECVREVPPA